MDVSKITAQATRYRASIGANYRAVRYNVTQLNVNPTIDHMGLDLAFLATDAVRNSIERWKCYLSKEILAESNIPSTALADYDFGAWEIFEHGSKSLSRMYPNNRPGAGKSPLPVAWSR